MKATTWLVLLLQLLCLGVSHEGYGAEARQHPEPQLGNDVNGNSPAIDHEHKLLLECQHQDYRTYIKCLKREKRHHDEYDNRRSCLDECLEKNCTNHACTRDCYTHCKKRIIEVTSKTVETTYECAHGDCNSKVPNVTTNIHITNTPPNITVNCLTCDHTNTSETSPKIDINNVINNIVQPPPNSPPICPCPGCYCYQWQPQITIGIGLGGGPFGGGCIYPSWPCFQKNPIDCSVCNNPFLRYQCSPTCHPLPTQNTTTPGSNYEQQRNGNNRY